MTFLDDARRIAAVRISGHHRARHLAAVAVSDPDGGRRWISDATSRRITDRGVVAALEREQRLAERVPRSAAGQQD